MGGNLKRLAAARSRVHCIPIQAFTDRPVSTRLTGAVSAAGAAVLSVALAATTALAPVLGAAIVPVLLAKPVAAQQALAESVRGRGRPEYSPIGIQGDDFLRMAGTLIGSKPTPEAAETASSFLINTVMELDTVYDDNVYRTKDDESSDFLWRFKPNVTVTSDWANHQLKLRLGGEIGRYLEIGSENYEDYNGGIGGRIDVDEGEIVNLDASFARGHDQRGSLDDEGSPTPTTWHKYDFSAAYARDAGDITSTTTAKASRTDYHDNLDNDNDGRDRWTYEVRERLGHQVDEGTSVFVEGSANWRVYDEKFDSGGDEQGSHGYEGLVGVKWDYSGVTFIEAAVGYIYQDYDEPTLPTPKGPSFRLVGVWNPTGLLTATVEGNRSIEETSQPGVSGSLKTAFLSRLDWEARYNLILSAEAEYTNDQLRGTDRQDDTVKLALRAEWLIDEHWYLKGAVERAVRDSSSATSGYTNNRFILTIGERL